MSGFYEAAAIGPFPYWRDLRAAPIDECSSRVRDQWL